MRKIARLSSILLFIFSHQLFAVENCVTGEISETAQLIKAEHTIAYFAPELCKPLLIEDFNATMTDSGQVYSLNWSKQHHDLWHVNSYELRIDGTTINTYEADVTLPLDLNLHASVNHFNPVDFEVRACASTSEEATSCGEWQTTTTTCLTACTDTTLSAPFLNVPAGINTTGDYVISWNNEGYTHFELQQNISGSWSTIYSGSELTYEWANQVNNQTYGYRVKGCHNNVCSLYSEGKTVDTVLQIPEFNTLVSPNLSGSYRVSWKPVNYDAKVERYKLKERFNGGPWTTPSNIDSLFHDFNGQSNGVYEYIVKACRVDENGAKNNCSDFSPIQQVIVGATPPPAPNNFSVYQDSDSNSRYLVWGTNTESVEPPIVRFLIKGYNQNNLVFERYVASDTQLPFITNDFSVTRYTISACTEFQCGDTVEDSFFDQGLGRVTDAFVLWDTESPDPEIPLAPEDFTYEFMFKYPDALFNDPSGAARPDYFIITADFIQPEGRPQSDVISVPNNSDNSGYWTSNIISRDHFIGNNFTIKACNLVMGCAAGVSINLGNPLTNSDIPAPSLLGSNSVVVESGDDITLNWDETIFDLMVPDTDTPLVDYIQVTETQPIINSYHDFYAPTQNVQTIVYYLDKESSQRLTRIVKGVYELELKGCHRDRKQGDTCSKDTTFMNATVVPKAGQNRPVAPSGLSVVLYENDNGVMTKNLAWDEIVVGVKPDYFNVSGPAVSLGACPNFRNSQFLLENSANNIFNVELNDLSTTQMISGVRSCPILSGSNWSVSACYYGVGCGDSAQISVTESTVIGELEYNQTGVQLRSSGGPGDMKPGVWWNPELSGSGWHFYWASELRYPSVHENYGNTYDLIAVWLTYRLVNEEWTPVWMISQLKQTQGDQNCLPTTDPYCLQFFEGELSYVSKIDGAQSLGRLQIFFDVVEGDNTKVMLKMDIDSDNGILTQVTSINQSADCIGTSNPDFNCLSIDEMGNLNMPLTNFEDSIIGSIDIGDQENDADHYSGMWGGRNSDGSLNQDFAYLVDIQKDLEWSVLTFYDQAGDPIWALSDNCPNAQCQRTDENSQDSLYRVVKTGFNPLLYTPNDFWSQEENLAEVGFSNGNGRIFDDNDVPGFRDAKMWANINISADKLPGRNVGAVLNVGSQANPAKITKVASLHDIRFFINGRDETDNTCDPNVESECMIEFTWFTDDDFPTIAPYYSLDGGIYQPLSNLCLTEPSGDYVTIRYQCNISDSGNYRFQLRKDKYDTTTGETIAIAESDELYILPCRDAQACEIQNIVEVADAPVKQINSEVVHRAGDGPIPGSGGVSGGAATYNLPLTIPPGRNGMTPSISVNYSSKGGNGTLGIGWSISAGSSIYRCPQTLAQDGKNHAVDFSNEDRLCLDGQRLMLKSSGNYWDNGSKYSTEQDSFVQVTQDTAWQFTVQTKSGRTNTYKQKQSGSSNQKTTWQLVKESDSFGNTIQYSYALYGTNEWLLDSIRYTGKNNVAGDRVIAFTYEDRELGYATKFLAGEKTETTQRLTRISASSPAGVYRSYDFTYLASRRVVDNLLLLDVVKETAKNNVSRDVLQADWQGDRLFTLDNPNNQNSSHTVGLPNAGSVVMDLGTIGDINDGSIETQEDLDGFEINSLRVGPDITGDGNKELIAGGNTLLFYDANNQFNGHLTLQGGRLPITNGQANADYNGDGITDLVLFPENDGDFYEIAMWKGNPLDSSDTDINSYFHTYSTTVPKYEAPANTTGFNRDMRSADFNNDGFPDLVYTRKEDASCGQLCEREIFYRANLGVPGAVCTGTGQDRMCEARFAAEPQDPLTSITYNSIFTDHTESFILKDLNQDGHTDIVINGFKGELLEVHFYNLAANPNGFTRKTAKQLGLTENNEDVLTNFTHGYYSDLNADGLEDFLYVGNKERTDGGERTWFYKLNMGQFSGDELYGDETSINLSGIPLVCGNPRVPNSIDNSCRPRDVASRLFFSDINSDGISDILVPNNQNVLIDVCLDATLVQAPGGIAVYDPSSHAGPPPNPILEPFDAVVCSKNYSEPDTNPPPTPDPTRPTFYDFNGLFSSLDKSVYGHDAYVIQAQTGSSGEVIISSEYESVDDQQAPIYKTVGSGNTSGDFFGDGDDDYFSRVSCPYRSNNDPLNGGGAVVCNAGLIKFDDANPTLLQYINDEYPGQSLTMAKTTIANNIVVTAGDTVAGEFFITRNDSTVSGLVASVTKPTLNLVTEWKYQPLSTHPKDRPDGTSENSPFPLYSVPDRLNSDSYVDEDFTAGEHFYFNSSMYVVAEMRQTNNYGNNTLNEYAYEEAVYNNQGRGFQGFRKIKVRSNPDDMDTSVRYETVSESTFHQVFPMAGKLESIRVTKRDANLNEVVVNEENYCYAGQNYVEQPYSCETTAMSFDTDTAIVYHPLIHKESINRELNGGAMTSTMEMTLNYDTFGNITNQSDTINTYDIANNGSLLRSETTVTSNEYYTADEINWWVDRLDKATVENSSPNNGQNHVTKSRFFWQPYTINPKRELECQYTYINQLDDPSSCSSVINDNNIFRNSFTYDAFGNITEIEATATKHFGNRLASRRINTDYSVYQGYFPNQIIQINTKGFNQSSDFVYDVNTGQVTESVLPDGNFVITTYDAFGFKLTEEMHNSNSVGEASDGFVPIVHTAMRNCYTTCADEQNSIVKAVRDSVNQGELISGTPQLKYYSEQRQDGQPLVKTWYDSANNPVLTQTWHSDSGVGGQTNSNYVVNITSPLGINVIGTQPFTKTEGAALNTALTYPSISVADAQGRVIEKITTTGGLNDVMGANCTINTSYDHLGAFTEVRAGNSNSTCPELSGGVNTLLMSRVYDATGRLLTTEDALDHSVHYRYDASGNPSHLIDAAGNTIATYFDALGRKIQVEDPNMGTKLFSYNGFGEVISEKYEGETYATYFEYDDLGRITNQYSNVRANRAPVSGVRSYRDTYEYDSLVLGQLTSVIRESNLPDNTCGTNCFEERYKKEFDYDESNRMISERTVLYKAVSEEEGFPDATYITEYRYDGYYNRLKQTIYNGTYSIENRYTDYHGSLSHQIEATTGQELMKINAWNHRGQEVGRIFNNNPDMATEADYYSSTGQVAQIRNKSADSGLEKLGYQYDVWGNILKQELNRSGVSPTFNGSASETFRYDKLHRITESFGSGVTAKNYEYDVTGLGNIKKKSDFSDQYSYGTHRGGLHCVQNYSGDNLDGTPGPNAVTQADNLVGLGITIDYNYDRRGNRILDCLNGIETATYKYDYNNLLVQSSSEVAGSIQNLSFNYGADTQRYRKVDAINNEITLYANKDYEEIYDASTGELEEQKYYLTSYLTVTRDRNNRTKVNFMQMDRLGSTTQILDENGEVLHTKSYDAFGKPRNGDWSANGGGLFKAKLSFDAASIDNKGAVVLDEGAIDISKRGFTNHEHLDEMQLIHMNGRMYDYNNGRFLSVDPFIQEPTSTQSMNPYTYIFNNPLSGTDPTGYKSEDTFTVTGSNIRFGKDNSAVGNGLPAAYLSNSGKSQNDSSASSVNRNVNGKDSIGTKGPQTEQSNNFNQNSGGGISSTGGPSTNIFDDSTQETNSNIEGIEELDKFQLLAKSTEIGEYNEQTIRALMFKDMASHIPEKQFRVLFGNISRKLKIEIDVTNSNNIMGLAVFDIDGEIVTSAVSHMTFLDETIQGDPTSRSGMFGEAQSSIFTAKDRGMTSLVFMRKGADQIMTTNSRTFQNMANQTGVPVVFIDADPAPYRPSLQDTGSIYLWEPNRDLKFKDE